MGLPAGNVRRTARNLEIAVFRTPYLGSGLASLDAAVERARQAILNRQRRGRSVNRIGERDWAEVRDLVQRLTRAFDPMTATRNRREPLPLREHCAAHVAVAETIAEPPPVDAGELAPKAGKVAASPLWRGEAGESAAVFFERLCDQATPALPLMPDDYPDFYRCLIAGETVRPRIPVHPRLYIWGPYEARLQQTDVMVLGSLNEGTWPKAADPGAWLNRPMRKSLSLPLPEEEIGRAAHDMSIFLGADTVILTRAGKVDGVPKVPSRWLLRLSALLDGLELSHKLKPATPWLNWARARDHVPLHKPVAAPSPRPPLALRPRKVSVSDVETWIANPYAIFARHVLKLEAMPMLGVAPGPQERGQIIHEALSQFSRKHPDKLPEHIVREFMAAAAGVISDYAQEPRVRAFWLPRLVRFAHWFAATESRRRSGVLALHAEVDGQLVLAMPAGPFELRARADRLDATATGLMITDYKTGQMPTDSAVLKGLAPQLPLEAAMLLAGAFTGVAATHVSGLRYIRATGAEPPGEERIVILKDTDMADFAAKALDGLLRLITFYDDPANPYRALRRPGFRYDFDDYAHLARVGEWSADSTEETS